MPNLVTQDSQTQLTLLRKQPQEYLQAISAKDEREAITAGLIPIAGIKKEIGVTKVAAMLTLMIHETVKFFNVGKTMNDLQCAETVRLILNDYYYLNIADFKLCFDRLKKGEYGKAYDRMDGQIILLALQEYAGKRLEIAETISRNKHEELRKADELFYVKTDGKYLKDEGSDVFSETEMENATAFDFGTAQKLKVNLSAYNPEIEPASKPDVGLIEWMRIHAPGLLKPTQTADYLERRRKLVALKEEIEASADFPDEEISKRVNEILK